MSDSPWETLLQAHRSREPSESSGPQRHQPKAAILACSDARVPPSVIFDQPAGNLFVIRIAGNTASPAAVASLDYAVSELNVDLIVVLGHTHCGAVTAAAAGTCGGHLEPIVAPICEIAQTNPTMDIDQIAKHNVAVTIAALRSHKGPVGDAEAADRLEIRGAIHDLTTGRLEPITTRMTRPYEKYPTSPTKHTPQTPVEAP